MITAAPAKEQTLYRYWHGDDLLYVGIAINAYTRASQHSGSASWWPEASHVTFEKYASRAEVLIAEKLAIKSEKPQYNITHNIGTRRPEKLYEQIVQKQFGEWARHSKETQRAVALEKNRILTGLEFLRQWNDMGPEDDHQDLGTGLTDPDCCGECSLFYDIWMMTDDPENLAGYDFDAESGAE